MKQLLWLVLAVSLATNIVVSSVTDGALSIVVNAVSGVLVLACIAGLVVEHRSARSRS